MYKIVALNKMGEGMAVKGAEASEGWEKGPRVVLDEYRKFMNRE